MRLVHRLFVFVFAVSQLAWIILPEEALVLRMGVSENPPISSLKSFAPLFLRRYDYSIKNKPEVSK